MSVTNIRYGREMLRFFLTRRLMLQFFLPYLLPAARTLPDFLMALFCIQIIWEQWASPAICQSTFRTPTNQENLHLLSSSHMMGQPLAPKNWWSKRRKWLTKQIRLLYCTFTPRARCIFSGRWLFYSTFKGNELFIWMQRAKSNGKGIKKVIWLQGFK